VLSDKEISTPTFCMLFTSQNSHQINFSINKARLIDSYYDYSEKYCAMITFLPKLMTEDDKSVLDELIYFNFAEEVGSSSNQSPN
jgi:hypothetical protein